MSVQYRRWLPRAVPFATVLYHHKVAERLTKQIIAKLPVISKLLNNNVTVRTGLIETNCVRKSITRGNTVGRAGVAFRLN